MHSVYILLSLLPLLARGAPAPNIPDGTPMSATPDGVFLLPVPDILPPSSGASKSPQASKPPAPMVMAYYPDWAASSFPPEQVDFKRFDWIDFAFALPGPAPKFNLTWDDPDVAPGLLKRLVANAHSNRKKVKLSIGGWTGSQSVQIHVLIPPILTASSIQAFLIRCLHQQKQADIRQQHPCFLSNIFFGWHRHRLGIPRATGCRQQSSRPPRLGQFLVVSQASTHRASLFCCHHRRHSNCAIRGLKRAANEGCFSVCQSSRLGIVDELRCLGL